MIFCLLIGVSIARLSVAACQTHFVYHTASVITLSEAGKLAINLIAALVDKYMVRVTRGLANEWPQAQSEPLGECRVVMREGGNARGQV